MAKIMQTWIRSTVGLGLLGTTVLTGVEVPEAIALPTNAILLSQFYLGQSGLSAAHYVQRSHEKIKQGDFQGAIAEATQAIQLDPDNDVAYLAYVVRARARIGIRDFQGAIADTNQAIRLNPKSRPAYTFRLQARFELQDWQGIIADANQDIQLNPKDHLAYTFRARARHQLNDWRGAIADATQAIQLEPKSALGYQIRAEAHLGLKDWQGAIADATQVIQIDPQNASIYNVRAIAYFRLKDYQNVFADANRAIQINPKSHADFHNRGVAHLGLKDYQNALRDLDQAIALFPNNPKTFYYRGLARFQLGDNAGATSDYDQAIKLDPKLTNDDTLDNFNNPQLTNYAALARSGVKANSVAVGTGTSTTTAQPQTTAKAAPLPAATAATPRPPTQNIYKTASQITVLIGGQNPGSGVIFAKTGNTYYVLTAKHVVATPDEYEIIDANKQRYPIDYSKVKKLANVDLAVVQFTSNQAYAVARLGNSQKVQEGDSILVAGWPAPDGAITQPTRQVTPGQITGLQTGGADGYELIYNNTTSVGMSGGPVFNAAGELIGVHGRASGSQERGKTGFNLGIPINLFLQLAPQTGLNLQQLGLRAEK
jgi:tetratricopeptide (TPR) repeat protein